MGGSRPRPSRRSSIYSPRLARVMTAEDMTLFVWIFEDAYLVDIDLTSWDKFIALYLVAPHAAERYERNRLLFIVEFHRVRNWNITFNHLDHDPAAEDGPPEQLVWRIGHFAVQPVEGGLQFAFWGSDYHPHITIVCESVDIREMPYQIAGRLFPGWDMTPRRFIRPGLDDLARDLQG